MIPLHHVFLISFLASSVGQTGVALMEPTWSAVDPVGVEEVELDRTRVAIAQLVARRSHNPKVVSSILTCRIL